MENLDASQLAALVAVGRSGRLRLLLETHRMLGPFYRVCFLASAARSGILRALADGPVTFDVLAERHAAAGPASRDVLRAFLDVGVRLRELGLVDGAYTIRSHAAAALADPENDAVAAFLEEAAELHDPLLLRAPLLARRGERLTLDNQDGELVARSSRLVEPLVEAAIDRVIPTGGSMDLLEVGCGSGVYIRHALERNPQASALGLELQPDVAVAARENLRHWGLAGRARVETGDVRRRRAEARFDVVSLHNNIYYFPIGERVALFHHLRGFLRVGGRLLITSACTAGGSAVRVLDLWARLTEGCGALPDPPELCAQLREAGFPSPRAIRLTPAERYFAFVA